MNNTTSNDKWFCWKYIPLRAGIRFRCDLCEYEATEKKLLKRHKASKHKSDMVLIDSVDML